jgi:hypothetical protein
MRSTRLLALFIVFTLVAGLSLQAADAAKSTDAAKPAEAKAAETTKPVTGTAEAKVDKTLDKYTGAEHPHGFYFDAGASALFFNPPEKDSFPLYNNAGPWDDVTQSGMRFDSSSVTVMPRFAFGYEFDRCDTPSFLGEDLKAEFSSSFYNADKHEKRPLPRPRFTHNGTQAGIMSAIIWGPSGRAIGTVDYSVLVTPVPGTLVGSQAPLWMDADYGALDLNLGLRTEYTLIKDRLSISPYVGVTHQNLDQRFELGIRGDSNPSAAYPLYRDQEKLATEAWGATVGVDFKVKVLKRLTFTLGGTVSPLWNHTEMKWGNQLVLSPAASVGWWMKNQEDKFTFRAAGQAGFTYEVNKWLVVGANGGLDYWNYVPVVKYPSYQPTEFAPGVSRLPRLSHDSMLNWTGGVNFTVRFGGP